MISNRTFEEIARDLNKGQVIFYPTCTIPGIGCLSNNKTAIERIDQLKGRETAKNYIHLVKDLEMASSLGINISNKLVDLSDKYWPGPLTLVVNDFAIRIDSHPFVRELFNFISTPLISTSANRSGYPPAVSTTMLDKDMSDYIDIIIDVKEKTTATPSTIVKILSNDCLEIIRQGAVNID